MSVAVAQVTLDSQFETNGFLPLEQLQSITKLLLALREN
jgi:hypothetical protein